MVTSKNRAFFFLIFIFSNSNSFISSHGNTSFCHKIEKQALLTMKQSLNINNHTILSSWNNTNSDCCAWNGVVCSNRTGHVHRLHLRLQSLHGRLNLSALLVLTHLTYLDLSQNKFRGSIPSSIALLKNLEYLNLSNAGFHGKIPPTIGNLSNLRTLVLEGSGQKVHGLEWLSGLVRLKHLNLNFVDIGREIKWLEVINALPRLVELHLRGCKLLSPRLDHVNATSLTFLDLSRNEFVSFSIARWIFRQSSLRFLDMSRNYFEGHIPSISNTTKLQHIDLSWNELSSPIPDWIYSCKDLKYVYLGNNFLRGTISKHVANLTSLDTYDLRYNEISGEIPREIGSLCLIRILILSGNRLEGNVSHSFENMSRCFLEAVVVWRLRQNKLSGHLTDQFGEFKRLRFLDLTKNSISGVIPNSLGKLSRLRRLWLGFNKLRGELPVSIGQLSNLRSLTFGRNMMEGVVNETHFEKLTKLKHLFASGNSFTLKVSPNWIPPFQLEEIGLGSWNLGTVSEMPSWIQLHCKNVSVLDLSDTGLSGEVPRWVWNVSSLNLSHNNFHGEIPDFEPWGNRLVFPYHRHIYLSSNRFSGSLPRVSYDTMELDLSSNSFSNSLSHFLCDATSDSTNLLKILHLGNNLISGEIPNCWMKWSSLEYINLGNNLLFGRIPSSIGSLTSLLSLNLDKNNFSGQMPLSLQKCTKLLKLDLGGNNLVGKMPTWIGTSFSNLMILVLSSNKFSGDIPLSICHVHTLQILDISSNDFSGVIPPCVHNLTAMATRRGFGGGGIQYSQVFDTFIESVLVDAKGLVLQYDTILVLVTSINLSDNNLSGEIPEGLTGLVELKFLNLSMNHLRGSIPPGVGDMRELESLDLSRNSLLGQIPISVTGLSFLSYIDLSYNLLEGKIPESTQILSMDASSFVGNHLCGPPLPCNCSESCDDDDNGDENVGHENEIDWFKVLVLLGYVVGFVVVCIVFLLNKSWREAYFGLVERVWHIICVYFTIKWVKLKVVLIGS